eukprot:scaffold292868_cov20-Prasinocladus_malaysianus.AAC.1
MLNGSFDKHQGIVELSMQNVFQGNKPTQEKILPSQVARNHMKEAPLLPATKLVDTRRWVTIQLRVPGCRQAVIVHECDDIHCPAATSIAERT